MPGNNREHRRARSGRTYRNGRARVLARDSVCGLCGDRVASIGEWKRTGPRCEHPTHNQGAGCPTHPLAPSLDHAVPLNRGGDVDPVTNGQAAHYGCNASRGDGTRRSFTTLRTSEPW